MSHHNRPLVQPSRCRSCRQRIVWVYLPDTGKRMPVDEFPAAGGTVRLLDAYRGDGTQAAEVMTRYAAAEAEAHGEELHLSHFATCAQADAWRRG